MFNESSTTLLSRIGTSYATAMSFSLFSLTGIIPFLYTIFYSYFTYRMDNAIFNNNISKAKIELKRIYIAKGILYSLGSSTYIIHLLYDYYKTPLLKRKWTNTNTIELCVAIALFLYSAVLFYFGQ